MLKLTARSYCRPFHTPLQTSHGLWENREGLIVRLADEHGQVGFGEVAPIPWFGTETLAMAKDFCAQWCAQWSQGISPEEITAIPDALPACQFGFASALRHINRVSAGTYLNLGKSFYNKPGFLSNLSPTQVCALLPTGAAALDNWQSLWRKGHRTFKWKIGVAPVQEELPLFQALVNTMPAGTRLRLDANGGLPPETAEQWLFACDGAASQVEFLEQPLSPDAILDWMTARAGRFKTAIALDESVATVRQLQTVHSHLQTQGVYGVIYGVKPAIAGFPEKLQALCTQHRLEVVFSSALETPVAGRAVLTLAEELWAAGIPRRALGFGVGQWFQDDWDTLSGEALWQRL